jgi:hypothetical protein
MIVTGIRVSEVEAFNQAKAVCAPAAPALCGCLAGPTRADDGSVDDNTNGSVASVECVQNACRSRFTH